MTAHNSDVFKWISTSLGGVVIGSMVGVALSTFQTNVMADALNKHVALSGHPVIENRVSNLEGDMDELKGLLREAIRKMDEYHRNGQ